MTTRGQVRAALRALAGRVEQAPMLIAAAKVPVSFQRTLAPRSTLDQGLVTGVSMTLDYTLGALVQDGIEVFALRLLGRLPLDQPDDRTWQRVTLGLDLAAVGFGVGTRIVLRQRPGEHLERAIARTAGYWLATTGLAGAVSTVLQQALRAIDRSGTRDRHYRSLPVALPAAGVLAGLYELRRRRRKARVGEPEDDGWRVSVLRSLGLGVAVSVTLAGVAGAERAAAAAIGLRVGRVLPGRARLWRPLGHAGALAGMSAVLRAGALVMTKRIEDDADVVEPPFGRPPDSPLVSGGPGSLVRFETLGRHGRRMVSTVVRPEWITAVTDETAIAEPIRVYVGLDSAADDAARVRLALDEMERVGAFDRAVLMVVSPTGTGYVNHAAVESAEYLCRGDIATVALQYAKRPSILALDRRAQGTLHVRMLVAGIQRRLHASPPDRRPCVVLFGESLGAWISQDAFLGTGAHGLVRHGVDRALWIGTPHRSKWKEQVLHGAARVGYGLVGAFDHFDQVEALLPEQRERLRYFMLTHDDDAVAHWGVDLLVQSPSWLHVVNRSPRVPVTQRWVTPQTFVATFVDMKNAARVVPGLFEARGHDYRADLLRFVKQAYGLSANARQLARIDSALRQHELLRKEWIDAGVMNTASSR